MLASTEDAVRVALAAKLPTVENFNEALAAGGSRCVASAQSHMLPATVLKFFNSQRKIVDGQSFETAKSTGSVKGDSFA